MEYAMRIMISVGEQIFLAHGYFMEMRFCYRNQALQAYKYLKRR